MAVYFSKQKSNLGINFFLTFKNVFIKKPYHLSTMKYILVFLMMVPWTPANAQDSTPSVEQEEKRDAFNLTAYKPVYFLYHDRSSKIQASFKYKLIRDYNLFFSYTHLILWNLNEESRPFYDVNYNPELFYRWTYETSNPLESIDLIPYGHISNGKESLDSRSVDYVATQFNFKNKISKNMVFKSGIKLRYLHNFDDTNSDIQSYFGPLEINLSLTEFRRGFIDKGEISARVYSGGKWGDDLSKGGHEIGFTFRIMGLEITPAFYLQYFNGYSESLRYYNERESIVRFGILL